MTTETRQAEQPQSDRRLVVIQRNPISGSGRAGREILKLIVELRRLGYRVRLFANRDRLDQFVEDETNQRQLRCLVAAGGDGTLANVISRHPHVPVAPFPAGTENLFARFLKIRRCGRSVARMIHSNLQRQFDTAMANDQRFLLMASAGVDAHVVGCLHRQRVGHISQANYVIPALKGFVEYSYPAIRVCSDDGYHQCEGSHVIISNVPRYGFRLKFASEADPTDGLLDVRVFRKSGALRTILHSMRLRLTGALSTNEVQFRCSSLVLKSDSSDAVAQCDGDPGPRFPVRISIDPQSMTLIVPSATNA